MLHLGTTVTRKETRALGETRKSQLNKGSLVFEVDESFGRIIGKNSQGFITKGGCVMRKYAKLDGTTWKKQPDLLKIDIISKTTNDLQAEEATSSCTSAEICLKKLGHLPGHIKGRSASTKQILETVNLRSELKALKEENKATNEKVDYLLEEMKKMAQLLQQFQTRVVFLVVNVITGALGFVFMLQLEPWSWQVEFEPHSCTLAEE
ncbi:hypothetical protein Tco_1183800 [Tanacetum coccineum]